ncbi:hypothetical protein Rs2_15987 [Raphanus sativus]|nr:hypothetical protein Rs2_15987 [Raphanus sativus]
MFKGPVLKKSVESRVGGFAKQLMNLDVRFRRRMVHFVRGMVFVNRLNQETWVHPNAWFGHQDSRGGSLTVPQSKAESKKTPTNNSPHDVSGRDHPKNDDITVLMTLTLVALSVHRVDEAPLPGLNLLAEEVEKESGSEHVDKEPLEENKYLVITIWVKPKA